MVDHHEMCTTEGGLVGILLFHGPRGLVLGALTVDPLEDCFATRVALVLEKREHLLGGPYNSREHIHAVSWEVALLTSAVALAKAPPGVHDRVAIVRFQTNQVALLERKEIGTVLRGLIVHHRNHKLRFSPEPLEETEDKVTNVLAVGRGESVLVTLSCGD